MNLKFFALCALSLSLNSLCISPEELRAAFEQETVLKLKKTTAKLAYTKAKAPQKEANISNRFRTKINVNKALLYAMSAGAYVAGCIVFPALAVKTVDNPTSKSYIAALCAGASALYLGYAYSDTIKKTCSEKLKLADLPATRGEKICIAGLTGALAAACAAISVSQTHANKRDVTAILIAGMSNALWANLLTKRANKHLVEDLVKLRNEALACERMKIKLKEEKLEHLLEQLAVLRGTNK